MAVMYNIIEIEQTCFACPSQWEGKLDDGREIYIRYRWGYLSINISHEITNNVFDAVNGQEIFGKEIGDDLDSYVEYSELIELTKEIITWPKENIFSIGIDNTIDL